MEKLYSLLLIVTPIKKVHAFQKFMSLLMAIVAINYKEMLKKDFASKYFLEVNVVVIKTTPLQWLIVCCQVYFLSLLSFTHQSAGTEEHFREIHNAGAYVEPRQISMMKLFILAVFARKSIIDFWLGSK